MNPVFYWAVFKPDGSLDLTTPLADTEQEVIKNACKAHQGNWYALSVLKGYETGFLGTHRTTDAVVYAQAAERLKNIRAD